MDGKKVRSFVCVHCGHEIAAMYETGSGRQLDTPPGMKLTVLDA